MDYGIFVGEEPDGVDGDRFGLEGDRGPTAGQFVEGLAGLFGG